jgi:TRAP-type C4-dicarboxylate transport system permease small subunit
LRFFYAVLDKALTAVLVVLVALMVVSISTEIALNTIVQPIISHQLRAAAQDAGANVERSTSVERLEALNARISKLSAPVNTISQTLLVWVGILGSALALSLRAHLGVDALVRMYPRKLQVIMDRISMILVGAFSGFILLWGGWLLCQRSLASGSKMPGLGSMNMAWFYSVLVITGVLNLLYCINHLIHPKTAVEAGPSEPATGDDASQEQPK